MQTETDLETRLGFIDRRRKNLLLGLAASAPLVAILLVVNPPEAIAALFIFVYGVSCLALAYRQYVCRCPACGQHFFEGKYLDNPFSSKCMSCGLELNATDTAKE